MAGAGEFWVFAYGSLMWNPGFRFRFRDRRPALLRGYHRAFCLTSTHFRGTPDCPGVVLGLDRGGACRGVAYLVPEEDHAETHAYLRERELQHYVYLEKHLPVRLDDDRRVPALTYVADRANERYVGRRPVEWIVRRILEGHGHRGACFDYLENTVRHLDEMGIGDGPLHDLLEATRAARGNG